MANKETTISRCEPCDSVFEDTESYQQHIKSSAHQAQMKSMEKSAAANDTDSSSNDDDYTANEIICNICHKSFSGVAPYKQHLKSVQHFKQLEKELLTTKLMKDPKKQKDIQNKDNDASDTLVPEVFASCSVCKKEFTGPQSYQQHIRSKKHARKLEEEDFLKSLREKDDIHKIIKFLPKGTSESVSQKLLDEFKEKLTMQPADPNNPSEETEDIYCCNDCDKTFCGLVPYAQHMISTVHNKKLKQNQLLQSLGVQDLDDAMSNDVKHEPHSSSATDASARRVRFIEDVMCCDICHMAFSGPESAKAHLKSRGHQKKLEMRKFKAQLRKLINKDSAKSSKSKKSHEPSTAEISDDEDNLACESSGASEISDDEGNLVCESSGHERPSDSLGDACFEGQDSVPSVVPRKKRQSSSEKVTNTVKDIIEKEY